MHPNNSKNKTLIDFKIKYVLKYQEPILDLDWNAESDKILIAYGNEKAIQLELKNPEGSTEIKGSLKTESKLKSLSLNGSNHALLIFKQKAIVVDLQNFSITNEIKRKEGFIDGTFSHGDTIHLKIPAPSNSIDWCIWNIKSNDFQEYQLERFDHYGRGAVLHPSQKLIGACWSAYNCGFLIHTTSPVNNRLQYFDFGDKECSRPEYEAYAPSFNNRGNYIAFVVNPYVGGQKNVEKLCVYDIENQTTPITEIKLTDVEREFVKETFFILQDQFIFLHKSESLQIINLKTFKTKKILTEKVDSISVNKHTGNFVVAKGPELHIFTNDTPIKTVPNLNEKEYEDFANTFISKHKSKLRIAGDEEVHFRTAISNKDEIPKVYVEFGFEKAIYRLDTKEVIKEKLSLKSKQKVDVWFDKNQETQLSRWFKNNSTKKITKLKTKDGLLIEIFSGKKSIENFPNVRVYFRNSEWMLNLNNSIERESLPQEINEIVNKWIEVNYLEITEPWKENHSKIKRSSKADLPQSENGKRKSTFWSTLKNWWS